ncbi:MAG: hypothetical protein DLM68_01920 [Hyphomicrobiales bacterium]|nr:MAG: hypothetical protein DLM68_01920 [Hyphomicrobiales bacterium]
MPDPKSGTRGCGKSCIVVAGNDIAQHDGGGCGARPDADTGVVGSIAVGDGDIERRPGANHEDSGTIIVRRDVAEDAGDDRRSGGLDRDPDNAVKAIVFDTEKLLDVLGEILSPALAKFRMTQFSIARFLPEVNWMPFDPVPSPAMVRPRN